MVVISELKQKRSRVPGAIASQTKCEYRLLTGKAIDLGKERSPLGICNYKSVIGCNRPQGKADHSLTRDF
ncbi:hypothetical protein [Tolypothrix sp. PCC 7601]|uniref:hypothetical protein n=1 Tax=Tolypothrix sp. PCC 7601 TaxID=1188 RepID=UPI0005EAAEAF|nr:hypothetical protein [Tolypothrix sp. PCC 7601]EKE98982.1 hypothetical protein FDUTEX481_03170 [Tolypothrix sp. PCC 7601]UYD35663.1 hypothetical protein HG267_07840 [Tolypothrix sp. PCC 7601]